MYNTYKYSNKLYSCIRKIIKNETLSSTDVSVTPNYRNDFESMVINFQKLSIDAADSVDEDGFSQRSLLCNRWENILCKLSSDVSIREKSIKNREEAVLAQ